MVIGLAATVTVFACAGAQLSCDKSGSGNGITPTAASSSTAKLPVVDVPPDGKKFDPPIQPKQVPAGAWYCDMGTVHWAQMKQGNGTCPICKMDLKQRK